MDGKPDAEPAPRQEQYERVCAEIEAALTIALSGTADAETPIKALDARVQAVRHLHAALEEVAQPVGSELARAKSLAQRMAEHPDQALNAQIRHGAIGLKSLLND